MKVKVNWQKFLGWDEKNKYITEKVTLEKNLHSFLNITHNTENKKGKMLAADPTLEKSLRIQ